jgi:hypothetical protein
MCGREGSFVSVFRLLNVNYNTCQTRNGPSREQVTKPRLKAHRTQQEYLLSILR